MPAGFTEWHVLPHDPIEKLSENLWTVSGKMPKGNQRRMVVARLRDGRLLVHNAIALSEPEMAELDAFGEVAALLVPNGFHRQDAFIWKQRYPRAKVYCPKQALRKVAEAVAADGDYDAIPQDSSVRVEHLEGLAQREGVLQVTSNEGASVVFNDAVLNMAHGSALTGFFVGPTGRPSIPRFMRWFMVQDAKRLGAHLRRLAEVPRLQRIVVGHGATVEQDAPGVLRGLADEFCGPA